ncbi:MAG: hypothetical protein CL912_18920 [Deltaproteobacteria bacterium]|nr:hypothetical protein [Deltaproteobacteria bacterium]
MQENEDIELQDLSAAPRRLVHRENSKPILVTQNASFAWSSTSPAIVKDITFTLHRHSSLFIIGPVGCGKSTILKGLLSETPALKGCVYSSVSDIAFLTRHRGYKIQLSRRTSSGRNCMMTCGSWMLSMPALWIMI